jgi:predicted nucleotidyltransferase
MNEKDRTIVKELKSRIPQNIKKHLEKIIVYGSRARNTEDEFSDLDIAIIVDKKGSVLEQELDEIAYQVMWKYDFKPLISLKLFSKSDFNQALRNGFSFYRNVEREGIVL